MHKTNCALAGLLLLSSLSASAITIEDIADKSNQIIELDQHIAIAEKKKKLAEANGNPAPAETVRFVQPAPQKRDNNLSVLSVHGAPANPVIDVQYGAMLLQKQRGDSLPDGWEVTTVGQSSVTFTKKARNKPDVVRTVGIGHVTPFVADNEFSSDVPVAVPSHSLGGQ